MHHHVLRLSPNVSALPPRTSNINGGKRWLLRSSTCRSSLDSTGRSSRRTCIFTLSPGNQHPAGEILQYLGCCSTEHLSYSSVFLFLSFRTSFCKWRQKTVHDVGTTSFWTIISACNYAALNALNSRQTT
jgi:hypothetical protein